jgi:hypothetical protein
MLLPKTWRNASTTSGVCPKFPIRLVTRTI